MTFKLTRSQYDNNIIVPENTGQNNLYLQLGERTVVASIAVCIDAINAIPLGKLMEFLQKADNKSLKMLICPSLSPSKSHFNNTADTQEKIHNVPFLICNISRYGGTQYFIGTRTAQLNPGQECIQEIDFNPDAIIFAHGKSNRTSLEFRALVIPITFNCHKSAINKLTHLRSQINTLDVNEAEKLIKAYLDSDTRIHAATANLDLLIGHIGSLHKNYWPDYFEYVNVQGETASIDAWRCKWIGTIEVFLHDEIRRYKGKKKDNIYALMKHLNDDISSQLRCADGIVESVTGTASGAYDSKADDSKADDSKTGDSKTGDSKTGDSKTGDSKTGDSKDRTPKQMLTIILILLFIALIVLGYLSIKTPSQGLLNNTGNKTEESSQPTPAIPTSPISNKATVKTDIPSQSNPVTREEGGKHKENTQNSANSKITETTTDSEEDPCKNEKVRKSNEELAKCINRELIKGMQTDNNLKINKKREGTHK